MPSITLKPYAHRQTGFTLVELITVILILGVLAAVAIPRYTDLQSKARESKVRAIAGAMKSSIGIVKATAIANSVACTSATGTSITLEGRTVALNHCAPTASTTFTAGILGAANVENEGAAEWTPSYTTGTGTGAAGDAIELRLAAAPTPANCKINYTAAATATTDPVIAVTVTGC